MQSWLKHGLLFCFHSTWKKNKTGLMKNTHGKCFIISSSSPTEIWHHSVFRKNFSRPLSRAQCGCIRLTLCHFLSDHFRGICSYFLPASSPPPGLSLGCVPQQPCRVYLTAWSAGLPGLQTLGQHAHTHIGSSLTGAHSHTQETHNSFVKKTCRAKAKP